MSESTLETTDYSISLNPTTNSRISEFDFNNIQFGKVFSDHMFMADYQDGSWKDLRIEPYDNISLSPATSTIHYGQSIFEGLKAYKDPSGTPQMFRPEKNAKRFNISAQRMAMPLVPEELFMTALKQLVTLDQGW
ncbi:MAG: branched chain amino acid aminotransferase, partial [Bacteroidetes bacterium]|nr:branched chain amino acid aminotransferase [Bacteroidota bacterium]